MKREESVDRSFEEIVMDVQWKLQKLSSALSRYPGYEPQREIAGYTEPASKYSPDQPRGDLGRWTTTGDDYSGFGGKSGMAIDKAVDYLDKHALPASNNECAKYVRRAIEKGGGVKLADHPIPAMKYDPYLENYKFERLTPNPPPDYKPQKGDIAVFQNINKHPNGHIQMYNGTQWVSDFKQPRGFWAHSDYENAHKKNKLTYAIFRP